MASTEKYSTQPDLAKQLADLTSRLEKLERGAPKNQVVFHNSQGDVLMRAGTDPETDERGFTIGRTTGDAVLKVSDSVVAGKQTLKIYDQTKQVIVGDSETYAHGLRRPSVSHNVTPTTLALPAQSNTSYATQAEAYFRKSNPSIEVVYNIFSSDGATPVSLRFLDIDTGVRFAPRYDQSGNYEVAWNPAPAVIARGITPPLEIPADRFDIGAEIHFAVQAYRVFPGVGTFVVQVLAIRGSDEV